MVKIIFMKYFKCKISLAVFNRASSGNGQKTLWFFQITFREKKKYILRLLDKKYEYDKTNDF